MCSDNVRNFNYSNYHTEKETKIMVPNEILITLRIYDRLVSTRVTSACGEGSGKPACMHDLARAFTSRINKVCKLKKTLNKF